MADSSVRTRVEDHWGQTAYRWLAALAIFGALLSVVLDLVMWRVVDGYDPVAQTISELAAGPHYWIQDLGICAFAVGVAALAVAFTLRSEEVLPVRWLRRALALLSAVITVLAIYNEYGDGDVGGFEIHLSLVIAIGLLVPAIFWLSSSLPYTESRNYRLTLRTVAAAWVILAPFMFVVPDGWNGAYERGLASVMVGGVLTASTVLLRSEPETD